MAMDVKSMIYNLVKYKLPQTYEIKKLREVESKVTDGNTVPTTNTTFMVLKGGPKCEYNNNNELVKIALLLKLNVYGRRGGDEVIKEIDEYCDECIKLLNKVAGKNFTFNGDRLTITKMELQGYANFLQWNKQGIPVYSINYLIECN